MAYTKLERIKDIDKTSFDLKSAALTFVHDSCEDLRFDLSKEKEEKESSVFLGTSFKKNQVPYNQQMDIERLCLEVSLERFLNSGTSEDAFNVYFCYLEMYVGNYEKTKGLIEMLSEFEESGGSILNSHKDHYSHSVYVFALGLAIYQALETFRTTYNVYYGVNEKQGPAHFLKYWGLAALFHDIGYPFELAFEQIVSYFADEDKHNEDEMPYLSYMGMDKYTIVSDDNKKIFSELLKNEGVKCDSIEAVLAANISRKMRKCYAVNEEDLYKQLRNRPIPDNSDKRKYMDHAYFSAVVLYRKLFEDIHERRNLELDECVVDALSAIVLHNSLFKHHISDNGVDGKKPLPMEIYPLTWLLMFCDELQCWNRTAYGKNTRQELYPMDVIISFQPKAIELNYCYDKAEEYKKDDFFEKYEIWKNSEGDTQEQPKLKICSSMLELRTGCPSEFQNKIQTIVDLGKIGFSVKVNWKEKEKNGHEQYLSSGSFRHLYYFAVALNARYNHVEEWDEKQTDLKKREYLVSNKQEFLSDFDSLSLEYKLSNINQAEAFGRYLDNINCFYTDRPVDYQELKEFNKEELESIGWREHHRWLEEHIRMGWIYGIPDGKDQREQKRIHKDMIEEEKIIHGLVSETNARSHFNDLNKAEQDKDMKPMTMMLSIMKIFDGLRIYRLNG